MASKPNIYTYDDYRLYLKDWFTWMKETVGLTYREFSFQAGFKSPNQLLLVLQNKRNITKSALTQYCKVLDLKHSEKKYFKLLVHFNQTKNILAKKQTLKEMSVYKKTHGFCLEPDQYKYLTHWHYTAICEMANLKDFKEDGEWISKKLGRLITSHQAKKAIEILLELKLLKREDNNRLSQTSHYITTGNETQSLAAFLYHEQMTRLTLNALQKKKASERNISALTFTLRQEDYNEITNEINHFRKKIIGFIRNRLTQDKDDFLYQLNISFIPLSED